MGNEAWEPEKVEELCIRNSGIEIKFCKYPKNEQTTMTIHLHPAHLADENGVGIDINANFVAQLSDEHLKMMLEFIQHRLDPNYVIPPHEPNPENVNDPDLPQPSQGALDLL